MGTTEPLAMVEAQQPCELLSAGELGLNVGDVIAGKYRIEEMLAAGGMGAVFVAHHAALNKRVCIKVMLPGHAQNEEAVARFRREAQAAAQLKSQHVVAVFDVDRLANGSPYLVMEYLEGRDLEKLLERQGALPIGEAVDYVVQALIALAEAHKAGIVHRDLKPANLFLVAHSSGRLLLKVLDFGISKLIEEDPQGYAVRNITPSETLLGTPAYMSPEQTISAKDVDPRSDIWAMGVILHELLTGQQLFAGNTVGEIVAKILQMPIPAASRMRSDVPEGLNRVVMRCLERDPKARYTVAAELIAELAPFRKQAAAVGSPPSRPRSKLPSAYPLVGPAFAPQRVPPQKTRTYLNALIAVVGLVAAVVVATGIYFGLRDEGSSVATSAAASARPTGEPAATSTAAEPDELVGSTHDDREASKAEASTVPARPATMPRRAAGSRPSFVTDDAELDKRK